ncbi:hypothetical protein BKA70DRAFT_1264786 [Coprinopsis sp. MPI-PUGE-AT-0042]|nr:hypothetical protein BKA70DRAFT_1264786 [Coprinopsis sp. MPI-PUGE-AT-0042]
MDPLIAVLTRLKAQCFPWVYSTTLPSALPTPSASLLRRAEPVAGDIKFDTNYRSQFDIIWSCLSIVFASTWVATHPNVLRYDATTWEVLRRRLKLMFIAVLSPEAVVSFSVKQWFGAKRILGVFNHDIARLEEAYSAKEATSSTSLPTNRPNWTIIHSHFLQMGGYIFREGSDVKYIDLEEILSSDERGLAIRTALLQRPETRGDLEDRSKGDALAKLLVLGQIAWSILNCIARTVQRLTVTKLEVVALSYAIVSAFSYFFWWHKPLDVQSPIVVDIPCKSGVAGVCKEESHSVQATPADDDESIRDYTETVSLISFISFSGDIQSKVVSLLTNIFAVCFNAVLLAFNLLILVIKGIYRTIKKIGQFTGHRPGEPRISRSKIKTGSTRFPAFYGYDPRSQNFFKLWCLEGIICTIFGACQCAGWALAFHSDIAKLLWRISSLMVTGFPALAIVCALILLGVGFIDEEGNSTFEPTADWKGVVVGLLALFLLPLIIVTVVMYTVARCVLVVLALMDLAYLTPLAYKTPEWTDFIPHL